MSKKTSTQLKPIVDIVPAQAQQIINWKKLLRFLKEKTVLVAVVVVVVVGALILTLNHHPVSKNASQQKQISDTVTQVGKLILLPQGEQPTLAIINDASKYKNIAFLKNAANGDQLLVYAQAREAILYRPSINKIVAVAPLNPSVPSPSSVPAQ